MSNLALAGRFADALNSQDETTLQSLMADDVLLDGPFPLGKKSGPEKSAKALLQVAKLGVKLRAPEEVGGAISSAVSSPAGAMLLTYTISDEKIVRLDVAKA